MAHHGTPLLLGASPGEALVHCIFIHGRTQSPEDMKEQVLSRLKTSGVAFLLPRATGNSWYSARATEALTDLTREQLGQSLAYIRTLAGTFAGSDGAAKPVVIAGFSQGACLALEYAMHHGPWHGAMANLTGCRVGTTHCDRPFADLDRMPVYLTGSDRDPWVPANAMAQAAETLARARARLQCDVLPDRAHEVSDREIHAFDAMLSGLARQDWW